MSIINRKSRNASSNDSEKADSKFSRAFQSNPAAMIITRLRDRHIIELNKAFVKLSGFSQQEVIGHRALELGIYADLWDRQHIINTTLIEGRLDNFDFSFNTKEGKRLFCRISTELIQFEEPCMLSTITDLSEIKRVEEALRESEAKFKGIYESSYDAIMLIKGDTYIDCNSQSLELFGIESREKFMELGPAKLSPPIQPDGEETSKAVNDRLKAALQQGYNNFEWMHRKSNDEDFYADVRLASFNIGNEKVIRAMVRDISELKRVEAEIHVLNEELEQRVILRTTELEQANKELQTATEQMEESTQRLRMLFQAIDASPISVVITDWRKDIIYANSHAAIVTGYSLDELMGKNPRILKSGQHPEEYYTRMWATLDDGKQWKGEVCNKKKNGELFWESSSISPVFDAAGKVSNYIAVKEDITEQRRLIQEMEIAKLAAEAANQAKSTFIANMSHEIRTPLNGILGFTQLMQNDLSLTTEQKEFIKIINQSGEHLLALINDILEMSKIESERVVLNLVDFSLMDLLDDCAKMFMVLITQKNLRLNIDQINPIPRYICADGKKVRQVLINLIGNAIKFTEKGRVDIRVLCTNGQKEDQLLLTIEVEDTGFGIAPEEIGKVFEVFEQTQSGKLQGSGSGLGMTISRNYARLLGGDLTVTSRLDEGCTFRFTLIVQDSSSDSFQEKTKSLRRDVVGLGSGNHSPQDTLEESLITTASEESQLLVAEVPVWVIDSIVEAVEFGKSVVLKELISQEIMRYSPILGQRLLELANNYDYRGITDILKRAKIV
ncbi:MAG: PAS domain S-box protein [Desulfosporosinus sp.]|nr:PAS domain S-box protein [Desulfosporosinus sp.]